MCAPLPIFKNMKTKLFTLSALFLLLTACGTKSTESHTPGVQEAKKEVKKEADQATVFDIAAIMEAALNGDLALIKENIDNGLNINERDDQMHTALMMAAYNGHSEIVSLLIEHGAKTNLRDINMRTALMYASTGPFNETVSLLLKAGAEPNLFDNEEHFTALMFAAAEGQAEVVQSLLKYGAEKSLLDIDGESAYDFAMANGHTEVAQMLN